MKKLLRRVRDRAWAALAAEGDTGDVPGWPVIQ